MKFLIYSDVHGNLPAFELMLKHNKDCEGFICLGDLVNYGPWSNECVDLAISLPNSVLIKGNHEEMFIQNKCLGKNPSAKDRDLFYNFFQKTYPSFSKKDIISRFIDSYNFNNFTCAHTINNKSIYPDSKIELDNNYIIGHSHHQFRIENNSYVLFNAGSVGQNRKDINVINYLIFDAELNEAIMESMTYDITPVINKMAELDYPEECIRYYTNKIK